MPGFNSLVLSPVPKRNSSPAPIARQGGPSKPYFGLSGTEPHLSLLTKNSFGLSGTEPYLSVLTQNRKSAPILRPKAEDRKMLVEGRRPLDSQPAHDRKTTATPALSRPGSPHSKKLKLTSRAPAATECRASTPQYCLRYQNGTPPLPPSLGRVARPSPILA